MMNDKNDRDHGASLLRADPSARVTTETLPSDVDETPDCGAFYAELLNGVNKLDVSTARVLIRLIYDDVHDFYTDAMEEDNEFARERESSYANILETIRERVNQAGSGPPDASAERADTTGRSAAPK